MQIQKSRKGYKKVKILFRKYLEIPEEWGFDKLGNFAESGNQGVNTAINKVNYSKSGFSLIKSKDIQNGLDFNDTDKITEQSFKEIPSHQKIKVGDILYSNIGSVGTAIHISSNTNAAIAWNVFLIRPKKSIHPKFLMYYLNFYKIRQTILSSVSQTTMAFISKPTLFSLNVFCPLIMEQEKIVSILSNIDSLILDYNKNIQQTKRLKKGLMQTLLTKGINHKEFKKVKWMFGKEIEIPESWEIKKITNIGDKFGDSPFGSYLKSVDYTESGVPILQGKNIKKNKFIWKQKIFVSKEKFDSLKRNHCNVGDLIFQKIGASIGAVAIVPKLDDTDTYLLSTNMMKMSVDKSIADVMFLYYLFTSNQMQNAIQKIAGGIAQPIFNFTSLKKFMIVNPPLKEQRKIVIILNIVDSKINALESNKSKIENLKKGLMQKLITGQIRVKV